ncbi:MAG: hypothetical protein WKF77_05565 [Planctomycetaceae bacterium]
MWEYALQRVQQQLAQLQTLQLSIEPYQSWLDKVAEQRVHAAGIVVRDPIGSQSIQTTASDLLRSVGQLTERVLQHRRGVDELSDKLAKTSDWLQSLRNSGMKFCEDGSDPSPLFPTVQHHCDECLKLLNAQNGGRLEVSIVRLRPMSQPSDRSFRRQTGIE